MSKVICIDQILESLPHRYPLLLVDRIEEVSDDFSRGRGIKNVTINEPFFQGHYPGKPIMPGVLIIESMAQVAAAIMLMNPKHQGLLPLMGGVDGVKLRKMVRPGDRLIIDVQILWVKNRVGRGKGIATVDGEEVASMEMTFKLIERDA